MSTGYLDPADRHSVLVERDLVVMRRWWALAPTIGRDPDSWHDQPLALDLAQRLLSIAARGIYGDGIVDPATALDRVATLLGSIEDWLADLEIASAQQSQPPKP